MNSNTGLFDDVPEAGNDLEFLLALSARIIVQDEDYDRFARWFRDSALDVAPQFCKPFSADPDGLRAFLWVFSRQIWNGTPLPGNRFRPRPLPKPERNAPCPCGSGRKYKHCCADAERDAGGAFAGLSMLPYVLDAMTAKQRKSLPYEYLSPVELEFTARTWVENGRVKDAAALLEGLFADIARLDERAEGAFDCLLDCYDALGNTLKKKRLLERGMNAPEKYLRAAAMQRRCCILADGQDYAEAWKLFQELQRLIPNDPSLSHLEVMMLAGQGEYARAAERAKFWLARLGRNEDAGDMLLDFLRAAAQGDVDGAIGRVEQDMRPELGMLAEMVRNLPPPASSYVLRPADGAAGPLMPDKKLRDLNAQWEAAGADDALELKDDVRWIGRRPAAWQSFEILDDLSGELEDMPPVHGIEDAVLPMLLHAEAVLREVIRRNGAEGLVLEWGFHENRPALRLLERLARHLQMAGRLEEAVRVAEWMVLTLNPNDNQGMREGLIHDYLRLGRVTDAIALSKKYPDDMAGMAYGSALALFMDGQDAAALGLLKMAAKRYPEVKKMLLADKPRQPKLIDGLVSPGGKDEAWHYRMDHLDLWQSSGGLAWMRQAGA